MNTVDCRVRMRMRLRARLLLYGGCQWGDAAGGLYVVRVLSTHCNFESGRQMQLSDLLHVWHSVELEEAKSMHFRPTIYNRTFQTHFASCHLSLNSGRQQQIAKLPQYLMRRTQRQYSSRQARLVCTGGIRHVSFPLSLSQSLSLCRLPSLHR